MPAFTPSRQHPARDARQIRAEIERTRAQLAAEVSALSREVASRTDWRGWVRSRPYALLGGAFALGFWLGEHG